MVVNKVDKENRNFDLVQEQVFDLMFTLDATEEQLDSYGLRVRQERLDGRGLEQPHRGRHPLVGRHPGARARGAYEEGTPQLQITSLDYSKYTGVLPLGGCTAVTFMLEDYTLCTADGNKKVRAKELHAQFLARKSSTSAAATCAPSRAWMGLRLATPWPTSNSRNPWNASLWTSPP